MAVSVDVPFVALHVLSARERFSTHLTVLGNVVTGSDMTSETALGFEGLATRLTGELLSRLHPLPLFLNHLLLNSRLKHLGTNYEIL